MSASGAAAFQCPRCGSRLAGLSTSALLDCPACASPLAVHVEGASVRESIAPAKGTGDAADAASRFWTRDDVPSAFAKAPSDPPILLYAAVLEAHRTQVSAGGGARVASETHGVALAAPIPGVPLEKADLQTPLAGLPRVPFDPARLQKTGLVFDPVKSPADLLPDPGELLDERLALVYLPFWIVHRRFRLGMYEAVVDGSSGRLLHARAPLGRTRNLVEATLLVYFLAALLAMPWSGWVKLAELLSHLDQLGLALILMIPAGLLAVAAWAWDRLRFRYELVGGTGDAKRVPINRPAQTLLQRASLKAAEIAAWILSK